jgi:hypothetical protein
MKNKDLLTKIFAYVGTVLIWIPILLPIFLGLVSLVREGLFRFDFLLPAELFAVILSGAVLLIWAVFLAKTNRVAVLVSFGIAIASLAGSQVAAVMTGLASGETEPTGSPWIIVTGLIGIYNLSVIGLGIAGTFLIRKLNSQREGESEK